MTLLSGVRLGPYEVVSPVGAGGMGEVYRARDTRLGREVALKVLPEAFARDAERLRRFEQEARAAGALNHPNILAVYDVGMQEGTPFLVTELLEGETLRERLQGGALPVRKALEVAIQAAHGIAAAHEKGIAHRDLKPANIFLTSDGRVKILDFGLAKLAESVVSANGGSDGATQTADVQTQSGVVLGTVGYMSPEQVRGKVADARSDIFALGTILYEMLSGRRAFERDSSADTMAAILKEDPPELSGEGKKIPPAIEHVVRHCLEKNPGERFQSARDLSFALSALSGTDASAVARAVPPKRRIPAVVWLTVALALLASVGATWFFAARPAAGIRIQFAIPASGEVSQMALSRDGSMLAFVSPEANSALPMIYVQPIGSAEAKLLAGTEGASYPFWSPDAAYVAFFADGKLKKVPATGGSPQVLANVLAARGGSWGSRDVIIYARDAGGPLWRVGADGTGNAPLTQEIFVKEDNTHRWPLFLPDGNHFLLWAGNFGNSKDDRTSGIYAGSLDNNKERRLLALCHSSFGYDSKRLYYADEEHQLVSAAFDTSKGVISGSAAVVTNSVGYQPSVWWTALTVAQNGTLVYNESAGAALSELTWMDRSGKVQGKVGVPEIMDNPSLSPDGSRVVVDIADQKTNNVDIWIESTRGETNTRFTFDPSEEVVGIWSRDGRTVAYRVNREEGVNLVSKPASGLERERQIVELPGVDDLFPNSWSLDGRQILCTHETPSGSNLALVPAAGGKLIRFGTTSGSQTNGMISPDGKWVAYASNDSGDWEIYVTTFPDPAGRWQVSRGGGTEPRWRGDGKEIFYIGPGGMLTAVPVRTQGTFATGTPAALFQFHGRPPISSSDLFSYDVTRDGQRFLVNRYVKPDRITPLTIVLNASADSAK